MPALPPAGSSALASAGRAGVAGEEIGLFLAQRGRFLLLASRLELIRALPERHHQVLAHQGKTGIESERAAEEWDRVCVALLIDMQQPQPGRGLRVPRGRQLE